MRANDPGSRIAPDPITGAESVAELMNKAFLAYNSARLREAALLLVEEISAPDVTTVWTLSGALTPAGLGTSCLVPLMQAGWVDWLISTGANLYHDLHYVLDLPPRMGHPNLDDRELKEQGLVRIYDILLRYDVLLSTDAFVRSVVEEQIQGHGKPLSTPELHAALGKAAAKERQRRGVSNPGILETAVNLDIPIFCPAPGDSSIGMNIAALSLPGKALVIDPTADVNLAASIVWEAKQKGGKSAVIILGGGAPKNFALQTEPYLQEILGLKESGHDFMIQITDARPDTGGLSGATPSEAVSWGKIDPLELFNTVVVYLDITVALPLLTSYLLAKAKPREQKRLMSRRQKLVKDLKDAVSIQT